MSWTLKEKNKDLMKQSRFLENKQDEKLLVKKLKEREGRINQIKHETSTSQQIPTKSKGSFEGLPGKIYILKTLEDMNSQSQVPYQS